MPSYPPFFIPGHPKPKGSWTPGRNKKSGKLYLRHASNRVADWCKHAAEVVEYAWNGPLIEGPVGTKFRFLIPHPKTVVRRYPTGKFDGDLDKLVRAIFDAMTGVVYVDDRQVIDSMESSRYTDGEPGVWVEISDDY